MNLEFINKRIEEIENELKELHTAKRVLSRLASRNSNGVAMTTKDMVLSLAKTFTHPWSIGELIDAAKRDFHIDSEDAKRFYSQVYAMVKARDLVEHDETLSGNRTVKTFRLPDLAKSLGHLTDRIPIPKPSQPLI